MASLDRFKITAVTWDSDRDPSKYNSWIDTFSSLVRSTEHGPPLEDFLDHKLNRCTSQPMAVPSFITQDDDFAPLSECPSPNSAANAAEAPDEDEEEDPEFAPGAPSMGGRTTRSAFVLAPAAIKYRDLPEESRILDAMLYNILKMNIKGSKQALLSCVAFPSYVQAVAVLSKHMDISRNDRKTKAFDAADKLTFRGDVHAYQIEAINAIKELFDAKCSIMDYALTKIMKSFDGKNKSIQYDIARDINTQDITDQTNVFDMIQGYCADMASVGDSKTHVNAVGEHCDYCNKAGHTSAVCFKKQNDAAAKADGGAPSDPKEPRCRYCRKLGHTIDDCGRRKSRAPKQPAGIHHVDPTSAPSDPAAGVSQTGLEALIAHLTVPQQPARHRVMLVQVSDQQHPSDPAPASGISLVNAPVNALSSERSPHHSPILVAEVAPQCQHDATITHLSSTGPQVPILGLTVPISGSRSSPEHSTPDFSYVLNSLAAVMTAQPQCDDTLALCSSTAPQVSNSTHTVPKRISEASTRHSTPDSSSVLSSQPVLTASGCTPSAQVLMAKAAPAPSERIALSLCDGMGCHR